MIALLIGGTVVLCIGLLTVVFGIPIKEFSLGNTMILAGAFVACTGLILIGLYFLGREFRNLVRRLETGLPAPVVLPRESAADASVIRSARSLPEPALAPRSTPPRPAREDTLFTRDQPPDMAHDRDDFARDTRDHDSRPPLETSPEPAPWQDHPVTRARKPLPPAESFDPPAEPAARPRRNIMFSSHRRDKGPDLGPNLGPNLGLDLPPREPPPLDDGAHGLSPDSEHHEAAPKTADPFESAWPQAEKARPGRDAPSPEEDSDAAEPARERFQPPRRADASSVTVVKSGVVDSMAYSLYSDGSIEAQMPEGMVRFASIDELRAHLDQRG